MASKQEAAETAETPGKPLSARPNDTPIDKPAAHFTNSTFATRASGKADGKTAPAHPSNSTFADRAKARGKNKRVDSSAADSK
jgi:hypothetical protein